MKCDHTIKRVTDDLWSCDCGEAMAGRGDLVSAALFGRGKSAGRRIALRHPDTIKRDVTETIAADEKLRR